jgi:regulator of RNase E activity RraA
MASIDVPAEAPVVRPPRATTGPIAWVRDNLFSSWSNSLMTIVGLFLIYKLLYATLDWAVFSAVFTGSDGAACSGTKTGACWPFIQAKLGQFIYGRYPDAERWRVNIVYGMMIAGLVWLMWPPVPRKSWAAIYLFAVPEVGVFQDFLSTDGSGSNPTGAFNARFEAGKSYQLTVGVTGGGGGMTNGASLEVSLYYREGASNLVTVAATNIVHDRELFPTNTHLLDFEVRVPAGHVIVCQPNNHEVALMGELSAQTLAARGVLGYVVDGGSRDTDLVLAQGFPVFCSFLTPSDIVERWIPDRYGEPVTIGAVTIATGDYLLGDRDGVVIVPRALAEEVVAKTEEVVATESEMRRALVGGMDPVEAYNRYGKF